MIQQNPCIPFPCGANANCDNGVCTCLPEYFGNPITGCRPECLLNTDCSRDKACIRNKCEDPCPGTCAFNAVCNVINHIPMCSCPSGFQGNAFIQCNSLPGTAFIINIKFKCFRFLNYFVVYFTPNTTLHIITFIWIVQPVSPCDPSPCGPNSLCRANNGQAVCTCISGYLGSPPTCRPECAVNSDCSLDRACVNQKCQNPCTGACGLRAQCRVINHNPVCQCPAEFIGDPFIRCMPRSKITSRATPEIFTLNFQSLTFYF